MRRPAHALATIVGLLSAAGLAVGLLLQPAEPPPGKPDKPLKAPKIAIIPVHEEIDDVAAASLERRAEQAIEDGAGIIVLELDTPGGLVSSAMTMSDFLHDLSDNRGVSTVAWVRREAISGGTMLAVACDEIIMSRNATLGDCGVIMVGMGGASTAQDPGLDAKIDSYVLSYFRSAAARHGYDPLLCEAFVRYEIEVWWLESTRTGERRFVDGPTKADLLGEREGGDWTSRILQGGAAREWRLVETYVDPYDGQTKPLRQPIDSNSELLTMNQSMAQVVGFSRAIVADEEELKARYAAGPSAELKRYETLWSENLVSWLTSPVVRMFLIALIGLGAYTEFQSPGIGLPGLVAVSALVVLLGAPYLSGLANAWEIVLVLIGILLIGVEMFILPGFGIAGITGMLLLIIGLLATFMPEEPWHPGPIYWPTLDQSFEKLQTGIKTLGMALATTLAGTVLLSKYLHRMPYFRHLIPPNPDAAELALDNGDSHVGRIGDLGLSETVLRPAGKARFGSALVDVVTEGDLLDPGTPVEIIERRGNRIVVRKARQT
jgi:membrane-bound serine protease (ClpP class)